MKRIVLILGAVVVLLLIAFLFQNRFLLGVLFVEKDKTTWADLDGLLGRRYGTIYIKPPKNAPGATGRSYLMHCGYYIFCDYEVEVNEDGRVGSIRWEKRMDWDRQHGLDFINAEMSHH